MNMRSLINIIESENSEKRVFCATMLEIAHHLSEIAPLIKNMTEVEAWVQDRMSRASEDISAVWGYANAEGAMVEDHNDAVLMFKGLVRGMLHNLNEITKNVRKPNFEVEPWMQDRISRSASYIASVCGYLKNRVSQNDA